MFDAHFTLICRCEKVFTKAECQMMGHVTALLQIQGFTRFTHTSVCMSDGEVQSCL